MIRTYKRSEIDRAARLGIHFAWDEYICRCGSCEDQLLHDELFAKLDALREAIGGPIVITSGYRCPPHNKAVGGADRSQHKEGTAVDIKSAAAKPLTLARAADDVGFTGIKAYPSWVHVDLREGKPWKPYRDINPAHVVDSTMGQRIP